MLIFGDLQLSCIQQSTDYCSLYTFIRHGLPSYFELACVIVFIDGITVHEDVGLAFFFKRTTRIKALCNVLSRHDLLMSVAIWCRSHGDIAFLSNRVTLDLSVIYPPLFSSVLCGREERVICALGNVPWCWPALLQSQPWRPLAVTSIPLSP